MILPLFLSQWMNEDTQISSVLRKIGKHRCKRRGRNPDFIGSDWVRTRGASIYPEEWNGYEGTIPAQSKNSVTELKSSGMLLRIILMKVYMEVPFPDTLAQWPGQTRLKVRVES